MYKDVIEPEVEQLDSKLLLCSYTCNTEGIGNFFLENTKYSSQYFPSSGDIVAVVMLWHVSHPTLNHLA